MSKKPSRSTTPHRLSRPSNVLPISPGVHYPIELDKTPVDDLSSQFIELNDSLVDLDSNVQQIQQIHESLNSFNESFASFLYALQVNAYVTEFNEVPTNFKEFKKVIGINEKIEKLESILNEREVPINSNTNVGDDTYMTNDDDGSFVVQPRNSILPPQPQQRSGIATTTSTTTKQRQSTVGASTSNQGKNNSKIPVGKRVKVGGPVKDKRPPFR